MVREAVGVLECAAGLYVSTAVPAVRPVARTQDVHVFICTATAGRAAVPHVTAADFVKLQSLAVPAVLLDAAAGMARPPSVLLTICPRSRALAKLLDRLAAALGRTGAGCRWEVLSASRVISSPNHGTVIQLGACCASDHDIGHVMALAVSDGLSKFGPGSRVLGGIAGNPTDRRWSARGRMSNESVWEWTQVLHALDLLMLALTVCLCVNVKVFLTTSDCNWYMSHLLDAFATFAVSVTRWQHSVPAVPPAPSLA